MFDFTRRAIFALTLGFAIAACGQAEGDNARSTKANGPAQGVMSMGEADAPIVVQEYASITCVHCMHFHKDVWPTIKAEYIATGMVRFEFHEFPTPPGDLAVAGFAVARCAGADNYFAVLDDLFANRDGLIRAYQSGQAGAALGTLAARHGLDQDAYEACIGNEAILREMSDIIAAGDARGVGSTPTFFINGQIMTDGRFQTPDGAKAILDAKLAELGVEK